MVNTTIVSGNIVSGKLVYQPQPDRKIEEMLDMQNDLRKRAIQFLEEAIEKCRDTLSQNGSISIQENFPMSRDAQWFPVAPYGLGSTFQDGETDNIVIVKDLINKATQLQIQENKETQQKAQDEQKAQFQKDKVVAFEKLIQDSIITTQETQPSLDIGPFLEGKMWFSCLYFDSHKKWEWVSYPVDAQATAIQKVNRALFLYIAHSVMDKITEPQNSYVSYITNLVNAKNEWDLAMAISKIEQNHFWIWLKSPDSDHHTDV